MLAAIEERPPDEGEGGIVGGMSDWIILKEPSEDGAAPGNGGVLVAAVFMVVDEVGVEGM